MSESFVLSGKAHAASLILHRSSESREKMCSPPGNLLLIATGNPLPRSGCQPSSDDLLDWHDGCIGILAQAERLRAAAKVSPDACGYSR